MAKVNIVRPGEGEILGSGAQQIRILENGEHTDNRLGFAEVTIPPGIPSPWQHRHVQHDEGFHVLAGTFRFTVGEDQYDAGPGTWVIVPTRGAAHVRQHRRRERGHADLSYEQAAALPTVGVTAYQATAEIRPRQAVFVNGCLGGVGRASALFARARGASVAGSCRNSGTDEAHELGVEPVVGFGFDPAALAERFDLVLDTPGILSFAAARTLLKLPAEPSSTSSQPRPR